MPSAETSPYAPRPTGALVHRATVPDPGLLPVNRAALPHLRRPCVLVARSDRAEWSTLLRDFLPLLDQRPSMPGAQGVDRTRDDRPDVRHQQIDLERARWRVLVNGDPILESVRPGGAFLVDYPCERGLTATVPFWERPEVESREAEVKWREDLGAKHAFIGALLEARIIQPITDDARRAVYTAAAKALERLENDGSLSGRTPSKSVEARCKVLRVRLAHMEARLAGEDPFDFEAEPSPVIARGAARRVKRADKEGA